MSGQETGGLREQIIQVVRTHAIDSTRNDRAQNADYCLCGVLVEDWDEHWTDAALTLVQPELDAKDAQIAEQQAEIERLTEEREQYQRAAKIFRALRLVLDTGQAPSEWAKPWRDRAEQAEAELEQWRAAFGQTALPDLLARFAELRNAEAERDRLRAAVGQIVSDARARDEHLLNRRDATGRVRAMSSSKVWEDRAYEVRRLADLLDVALDQRDGSGT